MVPHCPFPRFNVPLYSIQYIEISFTIKPKEHYNLFTNVQIYAAVCPTLLVCGLYRIAKKVRLTFIVKQ